MNRLTRTALGAVALTSAATLALAGCSAPNATTTHADAEWPKLTIAAVVEPTSFDPAQAAEANYAQFFQPVFDTLIRRMPDGELAPMLATEWSLSDDGLSATLDLRDDVTFSDGTEFDAEVAKLNLERFRDAGGPFAANLSNLDSVEAVDDDTIELVLSKPDPDIFQYLGNSAGYMASPAQFDSPTVDTEPIGSGPYVLDRSATVTGSAYTYTKRDDYWDDESTWDFFDTLVIKPVVDPTARMNAMKSGEVDTGIIEPKSIPEAEAAGLNVTTFEVNWYGLSIFDRAGTIVPALAEVEVRQAINFAVNSESILQAVERGYGEPTNEQFNPDSEAYLPELEGTYEYDPEKAKELLAEAGYGDGFDVTMPRAASMDPAMTASLEQDLAAVGIRVKWEELPASDLIPSLRQGKYAMSWMSFAQPPTAWGTVSRFLLPNSPWNVFKTEDPRISELVDTALANLADEDAYAEAVQGINEIVVTDAWNAPWYRVEQGVATRSGLNVEPQAGQAAPSIYNYTVGG